MTHAIRRVLRMSRDGSASSNTRSARRPGVSGGALFAQAQRETRWHYQWIILHAFLPAVMGDALTARSPAVR